MWKPVMEGKEPTAVIYFAFPAEARDAAALAFTQLPGYRRAELLNQDMRAVSATLPSYAVETAKPEDLAASRDNGSTDDGGTRLRGAVASYATREAIADAVV